MNKRNENRQGYEPTKVGWIPCEWDHQSLSSITTGLKAGVSVNSYDEPAGGTCLGVLKTSSVSGGYFQPRQNKRVKEEEVERARVFPSAGSIIISRMNTRELVGANAFVDRDYPHLRLPDRLWLMETYDDQHCSRWLGYLMSTDHLRQTLSARATGTSGTMKNISKQALLSIRVPVPPLPEQQKIAQLLSAWDRALKQIDKLIKAKTQLKKGLMQQLLTGQVRFSEFGAPARSRGELPEGWHEEALGSVFIRISRPTSANVSHVLSITAKTGFVDQREKFNKVIAGKNLEKYVLLRYGEFSYNKGNSKTYPQGCIYRLSEFEEGAVPNVYYSFTPRSMAIKSEFYEHYFASGRLNRQLRRIINAGVRNDGLLNLSAREFFKVKVLRPPAEEQVRIAQILKSVTMEIDSLLKKEKKLREQKKGLMQRLLTGEVRVRA